MAQVKDLAGKERSGGAAVAARKEEQKNESRTSQKVTQEATKKSGGTTIRGTGTSGGMSDEGRRKLDEDLAAFNRRVSSGRNGSANTAYNTDTRQDENVSNRWDQDRTEPDSGSELRKASGGQTEAGSRNFLAEAVESGGNNSGFAGAFEKPRREAQGELTDTQQAYRQAVAEDQMYSGYATDPLSAAQYEPIRENREELADAVKAENREAGKEVYAGMADEDRLSDAAQSWLGGRMGGAAAGVGGVLGGVDANVGYIDDTHRDLVARQADAARRAAGPMGTQADWEEADRLQAEVDQYEADHAGENRTAIGDVSDLLLGSAQELQTEADQRWQDVTEDMSQAGKLAANVVKTGSDVLADIAENAILPGLGTMNMYLRAGGSGALEQMGRANNDPDSVAVATLTRGASAWLSNKLLGGLEAAYGKSILGGLTERMVQNASPAVQGAVKTLLNTEGAEEGLEDILNYAADRILGLDSQAALNWDEVKQDALVGYVLGVLTNGLSAGINYDSKKRMAVAEEAIEFAQSGMSADEAAQAALENTRDQLVMKPGSTDTQGQTEMGQSQSATIEAQDQNVTADPVQTSQDIAASQEAALEGQEQNVAPAPEQAQDLSSRMENGEVTEDEYMNLVQDRWGRQELAQALGLPNSDIKTVVDGLSLYLILQNQVNGQQSSTQTETDVIDNLLGNEQAEQQESPEATETPVEAQEASGNINAQKEQGNSPESELNVQEGAEAQKARQQAATGLYQNAIDGDINQIIADLEAGNETSETMRGMVEDSLGMALSEDPDTRREQIIRFIEIMREPASNRGGSNLNWNARNGEPTKVSKVYDNTYTKTGEADLLERDDFKYVPIKEKQSMQRAAAKIAKNPDAVLRDLYNNRTWLSEQVDAAWIIRDKLLSEASATNTEEAWAAYENFAKLVQEHGTEAGAALQAFAKQSRPGAAGMLDAAAEKIYRIRQDMAKAKREGKTKGLVSEEVLSEAEAKIRDVGRRLAALEYEIDQKVDRGMSEEDAKNSVKNQYLDIVDEINLFRHTGLFQDTKANKKMREEATKLNTKFRKMLGNQDMDYIQRYALCASLGMAEDARYDGKQDFLKQLNTYQKLAQLTGTGTWLRNGVGNGSFGIIDVLSADNPATLLLDLAVSKKTGVRSSGFELGALSGKARQAAHQALERSILEVAGNIDLALDTEQTKYDMATTRTFSPGADTKTAKGVMNRVLSSWEQWNGYMLQSSDAWFKGMTEGSVRDALIRANGWDADNLTQEQQAQIDETARQVAEYRTFQNKGISAQIANGIRDSLNKYGRKVGNIFKNRGEWQKGQFGIGTALTPYTTVPANLGVKALEFSPAGMVKGLAETIAVLNDPNATMAQQNQAVTDFGRGVTGTALIAAMAMLMKQAPFFKDWDAEDDKDVKAQNKNEGKSGMQFNTSMIKRFSDGDKNPTWQNDDRTINISSMEPFNQLVTTASLIAEGMPVGQAFYTSARDSLLDMPALQTLSNIENSIKYTDTPDEGLKTLANTAASTAGSVIGGFNPAPIRHIAAATDDKVRDTNGNTSIERAWNQILGGIPGARQTLPVKTDAFGNEISSGDVATRIANQYDAFKHTQVNQSNVSRELERIREATDQVLVPSRNGPSSEQFGSGDSKEKVKLTADERKEWKDEYGKDFDLSMNQLMRHDVYRDADDEMKAELIQNLGSYVKDGVKGDFAAEHGLPYDSKYDEIRELDNPIPFISTNKAFNIAESNDNWDAVDALIPPVRNMTAQEQDLMREKNSTLMSYYDFLTPNDWGYKADSAQSVHDYKAGAKANAVERGVKSASSIDKLATIKQGLMDGSMTINDANAYFSKQASDGDYDLSKGKATIWLSAHPKTVEEGLEAIRRIEEADRNADGALDEFGYRKKAQYEVSGAIKNSGYDMNVFDYIYRKK